MSAMQMCMSYSASCGFVIVDTLEQKGVLVSVFYTLLYIQNWIIKADQFPCPLLPPHYNSGVTQGKRGGCSEQLQHFRIYSYTCICINSHMDFAHIYYGATRGQSAVNAVCISSVHCWIRPQYWTKHCICRSHWKMSFTLYWDTLRTRILFDTHALCTRCARKRPAECCSGLQTLFTPIFMCKDWRVPLKGSLLRTGRGGGRGGKGILNTI